MAAGLRRPPPTVTLLGELNLILMIAGLLYGIGALCLAAVAAFLSRQQHRRRRKGQP